VIPIAEVDSVTYEDIDGIHSYVSAITLKTGYKLAQFQFDPDLIGVEMKAEGADPGGYTHTATVPFEYFTPEQVATIRKLWKNPCVYIGVRRDNTVVIAGNTTEGFRLRAHTQETGRLAADNSIQTITSTFTGVEPQYQLQLFVPGEPLATDSERNTYTIEQLQELSACNY
jgi:hypothetical protein